MTKYCSFVNSKLYNKVWVWSTLIISIFLTIIGLSKISSIVFLSSLGVNAILKAVASTYIKLKNRKKGVNN